MKSWLFLKISRFLKTKVALVKANPSAASAGIHQEPETNTEAHFRVLAKLRLSFFTVILVQQIRGDGTCWTYNKC